MRYVISVLYNNRSIIPLLLLNVTFNNKIFISQDLEINLKISTFYYSILKGLSLFFKHVSMSIKKTNKQYCYFPGKQKHITGEQR